MSRTQPVHLQLTAGSSRTYDMCKLNIVTSTQHCSGRTGGWLQMNRLSLRNNRWKFETSGELPIALEESIEYTSNEWKQQTWKISTCNRPVGFRIFTRISTGYALKLPRHWYILHSVVSCWLASNILTPNVCLISLAMCQCIQQCKFIVACNNFKTMDILAINILEAWCTSIANALMTPLLTTGVPHGLTTGSQPNRWVTINEYGCRIYHRFSTQ